VTKPFTEEFIPSESEQIVNMPLEVVDDVVVVVVVVVSSSEVVVEALVLVVEVSVWLSVLLTPKK